MESKTVSNTNYILGSNIALFIMIILILPLTIASGLYMFNYGSKGTLNIKSGGAKVLGWLTIIVPVAFFGIAVIVLLFCAYLSRKIALEKASMLPSTNINDRVMVGGSGSWWNPSDPRNQLGVQSVRYPLQGNPPTVLNTVS